MRRYQDRINRNWRRGPKNDLPIEGIIVYENPDAPLISSYLWSSDQRRTSAPPHPVTTAGWREQKACHFVVKPVFCPDTQTTERRIVITVDEHPVRSLLPEHLFERFVLHLGPDED